MRQLTPEESRLASDPKLLEICESVARGFTRNHMKYGNRYDDFLSACHMALLQVAAEFIPGKGNLESMLTVSCQQRCIETSRAMGRRINANTELKQAPAVLDPGYEAVDTSADVESLLKHATPDQLKVVKLRLLGWNFETISKALDISYQSARDLYARFITRCRQEVACSL